VWGREEDSGIEDPRLQEQQQRMMALVLKAQDSTPL
jgi:hypothetical protein